MARSRVTANFTEHGGLAACKSTRGLPSADDRQAVTSVLLAGVLHDRYDPEQILSAENLTPILGSK